MDLIGCCSVITAQGPRCRSAFVALMVDETEAVARIPLEGATPSDQPKRYRTTRDAMVQVTHDPNDELERPVESVHNAPDDLKRLGAVTDEAYRVVATSMMADQINQTNPIVALALMETALVNRNVPLAKHYIDTLPGLIQKENAFEVMQSISKWIHPSEADRQLNFEPSAPPLVDNNQERNDNWMKEPLNRLRNNILLEIDKNGDYFLKSKEFKQLHYQDVLDVCVRDTLKVSGEMVVYCAIMSWAEAECLRKGLVGNEDANIKSVLKDLIYAPRYGLMSKREFRTRTIEGHKGPDRIGIPSELNERIVRYIAQKSKRKTLSEELPHKMSRERSVKGKIRQESFSTKEKVIVNCLTCFTAVFD
ncbi:uncharacterized protein [Euwallacea fornicatus]|uniref:uncharacterized protein isoform X1 n=1 Tax=Euwallacea fornicatus TaxID=995702 RepID=UPI00338FBB91